MGVGGARGRLIEFCQRQSRAQFKAVRSLLFRDGDSRLEGFFRRGGVRGIALEEDFAARTMQLRFEAVCDGTGAGPSGLVVSAVPRAAIALRRRLRCPSGTPS